jgi:hypothetical protein
MQTALANGRNARNEVLGTNLEAGPAFEMFCISANSPPKRDDQCEYRHAQARGLAAPAIYRTPIGTIFPRFDDQAGERIPG